MTQVHTWGSCRPLPRGQPLYKAWLGIQCRTCQCACLNSRSPWREMKLQNPLKCSHSIREPKVSRNDSFDLGLLQHHRLLLSRQETSECFKFPNRICTYSHMYGYSSICRDSCLGLHKSHTWTWLIFWSFNSQSSLAGFLLHLSIIQGHFKVWS